MFRFASLPVHISVLRWEEVVLVLLPQLQDLKSEAYLSRRQGWRVSGQASLGRQIRATTDKKYDTRLLCLRTNES